MAQISYPADLPITQRREELLAAIRDNQVIIVAGETGSGKSTQLPKLCLELGRGSDGLIAHTQPRRIAARSIAERVAEELNTVVGGLVGYTVRFTDEVGPETKINVMTDGILLNAIHRDRQLARFDTIIIDEAHERSLNIDFLLGYLKLLLPKRPDLKVIVTSATIDTERFSAYFDEAVVVEVSGRTYPVDVQYQPLDDPERDEVRDQPQGIAEAVAELTEHGDGDILVFCSGEREIRDAVDAIAELNLRHTQVLPLFGRLSAAEQHKVFSSHTGRRVVVATNVAETSLTVPGIRYVVDSGTARISRFSKRTKVQRLPIESVSQASANQRSGRCGRLGPGVCIRLYSEVDFDSRPAFTEPEILRTQLATVMLQMAVLGLGDVASFPFLDPPDQRSVRDGALLLDELGAVRPDAHPGTTRWVTKVGRTLTRLPIDLRFGRMLVAAAELGVLSEVLVIVTGMSIQDPRERPTGDEAKADTWHARFQHPDSDFLSWLALWKYVQSERKAKSSNQFRKLCRNEFLNHRRVREWQDIHSQLRRACEDLGLKRNRKAAPIETVHEALLHGLLSHVGVKDPDGYEYRGARGVRFSIAPGSTLFKQSPPWVMVGELVETNRMWGRQVAPIDPETVERIAGDHVKRTHSDPWWDAAKGAAVANESVSLFGLPLQTTRPVQYGPIDSEAARLLLIRHALIAGEWDSLHDFAASNSATMHDALELESRYRRSDILVSDEDLVGWFAARIPHDVTTVRHFDRWWKDERQRRPRLLDLAVDDLIDPQADLPDPDEFPGSWTYGDLELALSYEFARGDESDGLTVVVPLAAVDRIDPAVFDWLVPGLRRELIDTIVRGLPKRIRKSVAPIAETVEALVAMPMNGKTLEGFVRSHVQRIGGELVSLADLRLELLPPFLRPWFRVVDSGGSEVATGGDLTKIKSQLSDRATATLSQGRHPIEQSGLEDWSFGELPRTIELGGVVVFPALVDEGDTVGVRLVSSLDEQGDAMWGGMRRLLLLQLATARQFVRGLLTPAGKLAVAGGPYRSVDAWVDDCLMSALGAILVDFGTMPFTPEEFARLLAVAKDELADVVTDAAINSVGAMDRQRQIRQTVDSARSRFPDIAADVEAQLSELMYEGFVSAVSSQRLSNIDRYLQAMEVRLDRLPDGAAQDRQHMALLGELTDQMHAIAQYSNDSVGLAEVAWQLQELRVSLYAQQLGTDGPVSAKRIRRRLNELA